jgi:nicotinate phosphoribosyltransferase
MNQIHLQTLAASKAARIVTAAQGRTVIDYGLRRIHGTDAGLKSARAFYIAGIDGTSNVLAGETYGIPVSGTMGHSYVQAHDSEYDAFRHFVKSFPESTLLVDTYDTLDGVRNVIRLAREYGADFRVRAIRLDSGDLAVLAAESRRMLNEAGLNNVRIFASSGLDEYSIEELVRNGAPIDGFGVGSHMGTSADCPFLEAAYKLVEYAGTPRMKLSTGKVTLPGRKQIFRTFANGIAEHDVIGRFDESLPGTTLLEPVMRKGRRTGPPASLEELRERCRRNVGQLPRTLLDLRTPANTYRAEPSPALQRLQTELSGRMARR